MYVDILLLINNQLDRVYTCLHAYTHRDTQYICIYKKNIYRIKLQPRPLALHLFWQGCC